MNINAASLSATQRRLELSRFVTLLMVTRSLA